MKPVGSWTKHFGVDVFEGAYRYNDTQLVPSWGGSMFEALMPALFVPEERWAPRSWGENHPLTVQAQIFHGMKEAGYGFWGFSPANEPEGDMASTASTAPAWTRTATPSNEDRTLIDHGFPRCVESRVATDRSPTRRLRPTPTASSRRTPRSSGCATHPRRRSRTCGGWPSGFPGLYGKWGFRDSVNVETGQVSGAYLSLDQGMIMAALGNALGRDVMRDAFADRELERALRPVIGVERFNTSRR